jgi:TonB family protein
MLVMASAMRDAYVQAGRTWCRKAGFTAMTCAIAVAGCIDKDDAKKMIEALQSSAMPDSLPVMQNAELPFKYPPELYAKKVQGNVTLRIHIDTAGHVRPESTSVLESSGYPALDSAAVTGARVLQFRPAISKGAPLAISVLFPVYFRHPDALPLPGDTVLKPRD